MTDPAAPDIIAAALASHLNEQAPSLVANSVMDAAPAKDATSANTPVTATRAIDLMDVDEDHDTCDDQDDDQVPDYIYVPLLVRIFLETGMSSNTLTMILPITASVACFVRLQSESD